MAQKPLFDVPRYLAFRRRPSEWRPGLEQQIRNVVDTVSPGPTDERKRHGLAGNNDENGLRNFNQE